jgi:hypothetical protein
MNSKNNQYDPRAVQNFFDTQYIDRGMMKWQGFFLSDHTVAIKQNRDFNEQLYKRTVPSAMTQAAIRTIIARAIEKGIAVEVQINERNQDLVFESIVSAKIEGFEGDYIYLGDGQFINISAIRSIKLVG